MIALARTKPSRVYSRDLHSYSLHHVSLFVFLYITSHDVYICMVMLAAGHLGSSCNEINITLPVNSISQGHLVQRHPQVSLQGTLLHLTLRHLPLRGPVALEGPLERGTKGQGQSVHRQGVIFIPRTRMKLL